MAFTSTKKLVQDYTIIDLETSGLYPASCEIIELAALKIRGDQVVDEFQSLVKPKIAVSSFITNLTRIDNRMLRSAPPIEQVMDAYLDFLGDDVLIGHNIRFDLGFLEANTSDLAARYLDTMTLSRKVHSYEKRHRLQDVCERYSIVNDSAHQALGDCRATYACYLKLKEAILAES